MAEKLHSELTGVDLHNSKIAVLTTTRSPAFEGEIVWLGGQLQVAVSGSWRSVAAAGIGWILRTEYIFNPSEFTNLAVELYFQAAPAVEARENPGGFSLISTWRERTNWAKGMPIDLFQAVQSHGVGSYSILCSGEDQYGSPDQPLHSNRVVIQSQVPFGAIAAWDSELEFQAANGALYSGFTGFTVASGFASVVLSIDLEP